MSPRAALAAAALAALAFGCSSGASNSSAGMRGTYDLVQADRYVFVTSSDTDELRVLDVAPEGLGSQDRLFVRAPNPLNALGISVLARPTALAQDRLRLPDGTWAAGGWVFVTSAGAAEISIVGAEPTVLREVKRLPVVAPVTALTALTQGAETRLYFATFDGLTGMLWEARLPATADGLAQVSADDLAARPVVLATRPGEAIAALLALPPMAGRSLDGASFCAGSEPCVVVATRRQAGTGGDTVLLEPSTLRSAPLAFGGPVRTLTTHGQVGVLLRHDDADKTIIDTGERVFALLDEERCGSSACGGGLAVSTRTATSPGGFPVAEDIFGQPMLPIRPVSGLTQGLALGIGGTIYVPPSKSLTGSAGIATLNVAGVLTSSNGELVFFDAAQLRQMDWQAEPTQVTGWNVRDASGAALETQVQGPILEADGKPAVLLADGALETQALVISWRGPVPGLNGVATTDADGVVLPLPAGLESRVLVGDTVTVATPPVAPSVLPTPCGEAVVVAVAAGALTVDAVPATCVGRSSYAARAGPDNAYIVQSTTRGYLGRAPRGGQLATAVDEPLFRPDDFDAARPALLINFLPDAPLVSPGTFWTVDIESRFLPYSVALASTDALDNLGCFAQLPGPAVWDNVRQRIFSAFPSANGVIELTPSVSFRGTLGTGNGARCWR